MKRRNFIKTTLKAAPSVMIGSSILPTLSIGNSIALQSCKGTGAKIKMHPATDKSFPLLEVTGGYYEIGYAIGNTFGDEISLVFKKRAEWFEGLKKFVANDKDKLFENLLEKAR